MCLISEHATEQFTRTNSESNPTVSSALPRASERKVCGIERFMVRMTEAPTHFF